GSAHLVSAELDLHVAVERHPAADVGCRVRPPRGYQDAAHRLAGPPRPGELGEVDLDGLLKVALAYSLDGECPRPGEQVHGVELVARRGERVGDVHQIITSMS